MAFVALDRRFVVWTDKEEAAPPRLFRQEFFEQGKTWEQLRAIRRVVVLAEAGSGKTEEMREQARNLTAQGQFAFFAALEDVATSGLDDALSAERDRLQAWRDSTSPAYFFMDSVDETKLQGIRLEAALRKLADGIRLAFRRAYVILSGRVSDWEFRADLNRFHDLLPVPADPALPPPPSTTTMLMSALRGGSRRGRSSSSDSPAEMPTVVLMQPFDDTRVRQFAQGQGVIDVDAFISAVEYGDLWSLARRPLDLDWMVQYWQRYGRFGPLTEMLELSLSERMQEPNAQYRLNDPLAQEKSISALERVGAAMTFGRVEKIVIPDSELNLGSFTRGFRLQEILPDWSANHLSRLRGRAVFDPSTFGYMRLHNDNEGIIRAYLSAKWLHHRRASGAPISRILDLLFCETYGFSLIRTSMRPTAAWLALHDPEVAREVIAREPGLLIAEGDPGSLSVPIRSALLRRIMVEMAEHGERLGFVPDEPLRRFSIADWGTAVQQLWKEFQTVAACRTLLLRIVELGALKDCVNLAEPAAFGAYDDDSTQRLACRALRATASPAVLQRYAAYVRESGSTLSSDVRWEALDALVGRGLTVDDLLAIVSGMTSDQRNATLGLDYYGPRVLERITRRADLEKFLQGVNRFAVDEEEDEEGESPPGRDAHRSLLIAASRSLMTLAGPSEVPRVVMDIAFRLCTSDRYYPKSGQSSDLCTDLTATPRRRRIAFWYVAENSVGHRLLFGQRLDAVWAMGIFGWNPNLQPTDIDWLLSDALTRSTAGHAALAISAAMDIWQSNGKPDALLEKIQRVAAGNSELSAMVDRHLVPRVPLPEETEQREQIDRLNAEHAEREAQQQAGWTEFIDKLREDPDQLRRLPVPTRENIDARMYHLWELLSATDGQSRYAIEDVRLIEPIVGAAVTAGFRDGLIAFWRQWEPTLESARPEDQRNLISKIDCMGICGVTVEAASNPAWPTNLTSEEALRAAQYATLELNGFPSWMTRLAVEWPREVGEILMPEILAELDAPAAAAHVGPLQDLDNGAIEITQAVALSLFRELQHREQMPAALLERSLAIASRGLPADAADFVLFVLAQAVKSQDVETIALYLAAGFRREPARALEVLVATLDRLEQAMQCQLCEIFLPRLVGGFFRDRNRALPDLPLDVLEPLIHIAFRHIRLEDDITHEDGKVFSPGPRDGAQSARSALIGLLKDTPGQATIAALRRLAENPDIPIANVEHWCLERAAADSEHAAWSPDEPYALEQTFDVTPRTPKELQLVAIRRIGDIEHDLIHGDSALADVFKSLPNENAVQRWVARELTQRAGRAYTSEREPLVADEKEPDVRLQSRSTDAALPIEIKIAESWSLRELEEGLIAQLGGRYLRARGASAGVYLIAHLQPRAKGWYDDAGRLLGFDEVVAHLRDLANKLAQSRSDAPQLHVSVINVSGA